MALLHPPTNSIPQTGRPTQQSLTINAPAARPRRWTNSVLGISEYRKVAPPQVASRDRGSVRVVEEHMWDRVLWLKIVQNGEMENGRMSQREMLAEVDLQSGHEKFVNLPPWPEDGPRAITGPTASTFVVSPEFVFWAGSDDIHRYSRSEHTWTKLGAAARNYRSIYRVNGHLYLSNDESILEVSEDGRTTRILASTRRRPAVTALDEIATLGGPALFAGPGHTLRVFLDNRVFAWNGNIWNEVAQFRHAYQPLLFSDGAIFCHPYIRNGGESIWMLGLNSIAPEWCFGSTTSSRRGFQPAAIRDQANQGSITRSGMVQSGDANPIWTIPSSLAMNGNAVVLHGRNLLFFVDRSIRSGVSQAGDPRLVDDGRDATVLYFDREFRPPFEIPVKFDGMRGPKPTNDDPMHAMVKGEWAWLQISSGNLLLGHARAAGYWTIPLSDLDKNMDAQRRERRVKAAQIEALRRENPVKAP
ncbi:MAG: hypothetical protein H7X97_12465 [Opitutaceae bacterium]|nr:hypothetical protein [Verrucomicrobiales bacterium]